MAVPLFDCRVGTEGQQAVCNVLASGHLALGAHVADLEAAVSCRLGGREVVVSANMTQALEMALRLAGVRPGDDVLTLSFNCLSSNSAIHNVGARPVWVDLDPKTGAMNVDDARAQITASTRALMVYYVGGYPADTSALRDLSRESGIALIEDANAAFGAVLPGGEQAGSLGDFAVFSFYANRQVNGAEGAALVCPTARSAEQARRLRRFGIDHRSFRDARGEINPLSDVPEVGIAGTMNNVNAALAMTALQTFEARLAMVHENARGLSAALADLPGITLVRPKSGSMPANWVFMILADDQNGVIDTLRAKGIGCSKLHQPNHVYSGFKASARDLPGTRRFANSMVALPCGWWITPSQRAEIASAIAEPR